LSPADHTVLPTRSNAVTPLMWWFLSCCVMRPPGTNEDEHRDDTGERARAPEQACHRCSTHKSRRPSHRSTPCRLQQSG
jgi:hypothetical protein